MRDRIINGRWQLCVPDSIADWDAPSGDYSARRGWEFNRFQSMQERLCYGMKLIDVGAEHGWISALYGREFVGTENMVLIEPSSEFWVNIQKIWRYNGLNDPIACLPTFAGAKTSDPDALVLTRWPQWTVGDPPECEAMAYRSLQHHTAHVATVALDDLVEFVVVPDAITIDVEGAEMEVLLGADMILRDIRPLVWVSIHPDLMEPFHTTKEELLRFMNARGYDAEFLGRDHEEHWFFRPIKLSKRA